MIFNTNSQLEIEPDRFFHPKLVSLPDVDASPRKRRVNLQASIEKVYETREGKNWKGKDIVLNGLNDGHSKGIKHEAVGRQECAKNWSRWRKHHHVFAKQVKSCVEEMPWFSWPEHEDQSGRKFSTLIVVHTVRHLMGLSRGDHPCQKVLQGTPALYRQFSKAGGVRNLHNDWHFKHLYSTWHLQTRPASCLCRPFSRTTVPCHLQRWLFELWNYLFECWSFK